MMKNIGDLMLNSPKGVLYKWDYTSFWCTGFIDITIHVWVPSVDFLGEYKPEGKAEAKLKEEELVGTLLFSKDEFGTRNFWIIVCLSNDKLKAFH